MPQNNRDASRERGRGDSRREHAGNERRYRPEEGRQHTPVANSAPGARLPGRWSRDRENDLYERQSN